MFSLAKDVYVFYCLSRELYPLSLEIKYIFCEFRFASLLIYLKIIMKSPYLKKIVENMIDLVAVTGLQSNSFKRVGNIYVQSCEYYVMYVRSC